MTTRFSIRPKVARRSSSVLPRQPSMQRPGGDRQTKLSVDKSQAAEREADATAERIAGGPRLSAPPRQPDEGDLQSLAPAAVDEALGTSGQALDPRTRDSMEGSFGHDFARVRVHTDDRAAESAGALKAAAYTVGHHVVFAQNSYMPATASGRKLLAHELTHVIQQRNDSSPQLQRQPARDTQWKDSVSAARYRGRLMATRIRKHGLLSKEARAKVNEELAYFEGPAKEAYTREVKPVLAAVVGIEMPAEDARPKPVQPEPAKPEPTKQASEYEAMAAYYAGTRQSQLEGAATAHATFREGVHAMTPRQIEAQWEMEKNEFVTVASSPNHTLNKDQLFAIWKLYWGDRYAASQASLMRSKELKPEERLPAQERAESDEASVNFMLRSVVLAHEFLIAAENQGKHLTLDELNKAATELEKFHENMVAASGMIVPGGGMGRMTEPGFSPRYEPPVRPSEPPSGGGGGAEIPGAGAGETRIGDSPPPSRPSETIRSSPPPPPRQASRPGGPTPVTDVEVVKANVNSPSSVKTQQPTAHQTDWTARGGAGTAPPAYRDGEGAVHVSTEHPLMGKADRGGIPPVSAGARTPPAPKPSRVEPSPAPTPAKQQSNIGHADTGQAPPSAKPAADPMAKTPPALDPAPPPQKPVAVDAKTGDAVAESHREQANRGQIPPPQRISAEGVERIRNQPRPSAGGRRGAGNNVNYSTDHENHQLAWQRLGGHGDAPPAFIYDGQVYLDPSNGPSGK